MLDSQSQAEAFDTSDVNFQHNLCRFCPEDMFLHSVCRSVDGPGYCGSHSSCVPSSRPDWHSELSELQMVALPWRFITILIILQDMFLPPLLSWNLASGRFSQPIFGRKKPVEIR